MLQRNTHVYSGGLAFLMCVVMPINIASAKDQSHLESIKQFISTPPIVAEMVFSLGRRPTEYRHDGVAVQGTNIVSRMYHVRWQHDAFYIREISRKEDLTNTLVLDTLVSRAGGDYWHIDSGESHGNYYHVKAESDGGGMSVAPLARAWEFEVLAVLRLGIKSIGRNKVTWDGSVFRSTTEDGNGVIGQLRLNPEGKVEAADIFYSKSQNPVLGEGMGVVVKYSYTGLGDNAVMPNLITIEDTQGNQQFRYEIHTFVQAQRLQPLSTFQITEFLRQVPKPLKVFSNGSWYLAGMSDNPAGVLVKQPKPDLPPKGSGKRWFWVLFPTLSLGIIVLLIWKSRAGQI